MANDDHSNNDDSNDVDMTQSINTTLEASKPKDLLFDDINFEVCMPTTIRDSRANQLADDLKNQRKQKSLARKVNFIVDSAATICVVCDIKYLQNIKKIDSSVL